MKQTIREELQEYEDEQDNGYKLKTDDELIDMICEFGNGELEFHTLDINRLLVEKQRLVELLEEIYWWQDELDAEHWWVDAPNKGGFDFDKIEQYIKGKI